MIYPFCRHNLKIFVGIFSINKHVLVDFMYTFVVCKNSYKTVCNCMYVRIVCIQFGTDFHKL